MKGPHPAPPRHDRALRLAAAATALLLAACQTTPPPGDLIVGEVADVPRTRVELTRGATHGDLHPALRAGATPADAAAGRLLLAGCAWPDPAAPGGARLYTVTTLVPAGVDRPRGLWLQLGVEDAAFETRPLQGRFPAVHGRFIAAAQLETPLDAHTGVPWRLRPEDPPQFQVHCRPDAAAPTQAAAIGFRRVGETELRFAAAEAQRYAQFTDAELAAGAVVRVRCRLRMADGTDWHTPEFVARAPAGLDLAPGDVVRLRAGTEEGALQAGSPGQVIERTRPSSARGPASGPGAGVPCRG